MRIVWSAPGFAKCAPGNCEGRILDQTTLQPGFAIQRHVRCVIIAALPDPLTLVMPLMNHPLNARDLGQLRFLQDLPVSAMEKLAGLARSVEFPTRAVIFREGQTDAPLYVLESGHVGLAMRVPSRGSVPILTVGPGDLLGWSPVIGNSPMTATATALEPTRAIALPGSDISALCEQDPEFGYHLFQRIATTLSRRILATRLQLLDLFAETTHSPDSSSPEAPSPCQLRQ